MVEALRTCLDRNLTFAAFRWNGRVHLWAQVDSALESVPTHGLDALTARFVIAPFNSSKAAVTVLRPDVRLLLDGGPVDLRELPEGDGNRVPQHDAPPTWDRKDHARAIGEAKALFRAGLLRKVVLSRVVPEPFPAEQLPLLFRNALDTHPHAFVCLVNCPEYGTWLGASPEQLVEADGDTVSVDAIAGTMPTGTAPAAAQDWGAKERDEQELVTRGVLEVFAECGLDAVSVSDQHVLPAGPVAHLHSRIVARSGTTSLTALVQALHPTPAVCGTPRNSAIDFITAHEPHDRSLYAGYWGPWRVDGRTQLNVNIRCFRTFADTAWIHVGGGITAGSDADDEWRETEHKTQTWLHPIRTTGGRIS
jgi:isochorismate synthase